MDGELGRLASTSFFVCMDCGSRSISPEDCAQCHEPRLDLRRPEVKIACLDDDDRRAETRQQRLLWASIPIGLGLVAIAQTVLGKYAALVPALGGFVGYIVWGIVFSLGVWKGSCRLFAAKRRFPYLSAHQLAEPVVGAGSLHYRELNVPTPHESDAPSPFTPAKGHGGALKWIYLLLTLASIVQTVAIVTEFLDTLGRAVKGSSNSLVTYLGGGLIVTIFSTGVVGLVWLYLSWKAVPEQFRTAKDGRSITPYQAAVNMFVPLYNLYWIFYMHGTLCDAINTQLNRLGSKKRAPKVVAMVAAGVNLVPYLNLALAPILWLVYMFMADNAKEEMLVRLRAEQNSISRQ